MFRCQHPPMVQPVVQPVIQKSKDSLAGHFFRCVRWMAVAAAMIPIGVVGMVQWSSAKQAKYETELKRDLLERGLSVQEIERVLRASPNPARDRGRHSESNYYTARHAEIESGLIKDLAALNLSADDIERIHKAFTAANGALAKNYHTSERAIKDATFVKRLAQNGRTAAEIERLLKVSGKGAVAEEQATITVTEKSEQARIEDALKTLLKSGLTAEDVTRILKSDDASAAESAKTP